MYWSFDRKDQIKKFQQINQQIKLHYQLHQDKHKERKFKVNSISQLGSLLKHKNSKYNNNREIKDRVLDEAKMKGHNIKDLSEKIKTQKNYKDRINQKRKNQEDCYFYFQRVNKMNQNQYLSKNMEYSMFNVVQSFMYDKSYRSNQNRKLFNRIIREKDSTSKVSMYAKTPAQPRSKQKKNQYIKNLTTLVSNFNFNESNQFQIQNIDFIGQFAKMFGTKFLLILQDQSESVKKFTQRKSFSKKELKNIKNNDQYRIELILSSLRQVQMEYNKVLPNSYQSIQNYLWNIYLNKLEKQIDGEQKDHQKDYLWGITYLLFQAGRKQQFYRLLTDFHQRYDLFKAFTHYNQSIEKHMPQSSPNFWSQCQTEDVFYSQLIFILQGDPKFSSNIICEPNTLDYIWIILRTLGLYIDHSQNWEKFNEIKKDLFRNYLQSNITQTKISNMLYLLGYSDAIDLCPNNFIDKDDLIHLLIAIIYNPFLIKDQENKLRNKLTNLLSNYVLQLICEDRKQYIYYLFLIPQQNFIRQTSNIISNSHLVRTVDWNFFKNKLSQSRYQQLVKTTLNKYLIFSKNNILVSQMYVQLLKDNKAAINIILSMLINSIIKIRYQDASVKQAEQKFQKLIQKDYQFKKQYTAVFSLLQQTKKLWQHQCKRQMNDILQVVGNSEFLVNNSVVSPHMQSALRVLLQNNGFQVYFYFLQYVTKGMELALINKGSLQSLENIYINVSNSLEKVLEYQESKTYLSKEIVVNLRNHLMTAMTNYMRF